MKQRPPRTDRHAFLSYNHQDKEEARRLGAQLTFVGAQIWFDEWEVQAGDSIPGKVNEALATMDTLLLMWSEHANRSKWVRSELETAITRLTEDEGFRVIPVRLDSTPLPPLLRPLKWVELRDGDLGRAVNEIMGFANDQQRLMAIQEALDESRLLVQYVHGYGPLVCCPRCGASVDRLKPTSATDWELDAEYAGFLCQDCGFQDGGEV
jgi:hypothetical protein